MAKNHDFVFEGYELDYLDCVLKIHYYDSKRDIHTFEPIYPMPKGAIEKIEFSVDDVIYKAIIICLRKGINKLSDHTILCGFTTEQIKHIEYIRPTDLVQKQKAAIKNWKDARHGLYMTERLLYSFLLPNGDFFYGFFDIFDIFGLTNETIDNLYDEIMNSFVSSKIKTSIMNLSQEDICSKYKEYFEKDGMELEQYKREIEKHFSNSRFRILDSDSNEISNFVLRNLNVAKKELIMKEVSSKYGTYFENEDTELESYKKGIERGLQDLPIDFNTVSEFIMRQLDDINKEAVFWTNKNAPDLYNSYRPQGWSRDDAAVIDSGWEKKYISVLNKKEIILRRVCNEYLLNAPILETFKNDLDSKNERLKELNRLFKEHAFSEYAYEINTIVDYINKNGEKASQNIYCVKRIRSEVFADNSDEDKYLDMLESQLKMLKSSYEDYFKQIYGDIPEMKKNLLSRLDTMFFDEALALYREYQRLVTPAYRMVKGQREVISAAPLDTANKGFKTEIYALYNEYYTNGSILISDYLNRINKKKDSRKFIEKSAYEAAVKYFYNADSVEEVK